MPFLHALTFYNKVIINSFKVNGFVLAIIVADKFELLFSESKIIDIYYLRKEQLCLMSKVINQLGLLKSGMKNAVVLSGLKLYLSTLS